MGVYGIVFMLTLFLFFASTFDVGSAQSFLRVTVTTYREYVDIYPYITNASEFTYRELVCVCGRMFFKEEQVEEGLVAIQVENPEKEMVTIRTVPAVKVPNQSWAVEVVSFFSCNQAGDPQNDFVRGGNAYFRLIVKNNVPFTKELLLTISIYDVDQTPIETIWQGPVNVTGNGVLGLLGEIWIPEWMSGGTGKAYANVYSNWPKKQGHPRCPEVNTTFNIEYAAEGAFEEPEINNTVYQASFRLPPDALLGAYNVTVNGWHKGYIDLQTTTFAAEGIILGDLNLDHKINLYDASMIGVSYGSKGGDARWYPQFDLDPDGTINLYDTVFVMVRYGMSW